MAFCKNVHREKQEFWLIQGLLLYSEGGHWIVHL